MSVPGHWTRISINEIPEYHANWVRRIVGLDEWDISKRDIEKIEEEYNDEKYKQLLDKYEAGEYTAVTEAKSEQLLNLDENVCVSRHNNLYVASVEDVRQKQEEWFVGEFDEILGGNETVIELGSGYGYNLHLLNSAYPGCAYIGGEYAENAVKLGNKLFAETPNVSIENFNFYNDSWDILDGRDNVVLITKYGIQQLPEMEPIIDTLISNLDCVRQTVHFEPVYGLYDEETLLGLLRKAYSHINDYNIDMYGELERRSQFEILCTEHDQIGLNPLTPTSVVHWVPNLY